MGRLNPHSALVRRFDVAIAAVLLGGAAILLGITGALLPLVTTDASACIYNLAPPDDFVAKYQEGITATAEFVSLVPFGAQCSYVAKDTGETAVSIVPLWPSIAVLVGLVMVGVGSGSLALSVRSRCTAVPGGSSGAKTSARVPQVRPPRRHPD